jgi:ABC-2 type transport system ATP-binding protein
MEKQNSSDTVIQLDRLTRVFGGYHAVDDVSLAVNRGEIYGFVGLNGAGKSTTIHMMLSLLKPTSGSVYLLGRRVDFGSCELWEKVGFLEEASCYPGLTVEENLDIARRMQRLGDKQCITRVIQKLSLNAHRNKKAKHLSMGNRQRLGLAKAMLHNPEILVLDEPINGLDPAGVMEIREILLDLSKNHGVTVFLSSHLLEELAKLADRIGIIHEGKLVREVTMAELDKLAPEKTVVIKDLEGYFLRTIQSARGIY